MSKGKLTIYDAAEYLFRLSWYFEDEGDFGGIVGEETYTENALKNASADDREAIVAQLTAAKTEGVQRDSVGYFWESKKAATNALRACKTAMRNIETPWPEWAVKAQAAGWKAPKGWKP